MSILSSFSFTPYAILVMFSKFVMTPVYCTSVKVRIYRLKLVQSGGTVST